MITTTQPTRNFCSQTNPLARSRPSTISNPPLRASVHSFPASNQAPLFCDFAKSARALLEARLEYELNAQRKFIARRVGCPHTCEDLAQDALIIAWRNVEAFRGSSKLSTWITGISANITRQFLSRSPQYRQQFTLEEVDTLKSQQPDPSEASETEELLAALEVAIAKLKPDLRDAFSVVVLDGKSYEDAAEQTQTTVTNIKNRVHRARRALRKSVVACL